MDALNDYRRIIRDLIRKYAQYESAVGDVRTEVIIDEENDIPTTRPPETPDPRR